MNQREELIKELKKIMPCICIESYKKINRADPDCSWCGYGEDIADFIIAEKKKVVQPLVIAVEESDRIGSNESTAPAWQRLDKAVYETLKLAGIS